jgi:hypothetical protein
MADAMWAINQAWVFALAALALIGVVSILGIRAATSLYDRLDELRDGTRAKMAIIDTHIARIEGQMEGLQGQIELVGKQIDLENRLERLEAREGSRGGVVQRKVGP